MWFPNRQEIRLATHQRQLDHRGLHELGSTSTPAPAPQQELERAIGPLPEELPDNRQQEGLQVTPRHHRRLHLHPLEEEEETEEHIHLQEEAEQEIRPRQEEEAEQEIRPHREETHLHQVDRQEEPWQTTQIVPRPGP